MVSNTTIALKVADETWIAAALLHREFPEREDFPANEVEERARVGNITGALRKGVYAHAVLHCVANKAPKPGRYRMLFATTGRRRRLFRPGDAAHPARAKGRALPEGKICLNATGSCWPGMANGPGTARSLP